MLKRLELVGFKSFADKTQFDFTAGITAIVGPNGSGKSNIVDAIRWLLGEQSAKSLRGGEMADVIFNGSTSRRSFGFAEVSMTLDNAKRFLATDAAEVQVTRRVYRNGEGDKQLRTVKLQASKAERYQEYSTRLRELRIGLGLREYHELSEQLAAETTVLDQLRAELEGRAAASGDSEAQTQRLETQLA